MSNQLSEFPPDRFALLAFCDDCDHRADLELAALSQTLTVDGLRARLRCAECGSRQVSVRIVWTAAGGFAHGWPDVASRTV